MRVPQTFFPVSRERQRERRDERVDWANYKCTLLGQKLGNVPR